MDPPSYDEAGLHPPAVSSEVFTIPPPPSYDASLAPPPTPPPTYGEAVTQQPDPFPILTPPMVTTTVTSPLQQPGYIIHHSTQIGIRETVQSRPAPTVVVVQPQPVTALGDVPGVIRCPYCHHTVTTKVAYTPGKTAWCMCFLFALMGLVCGCCLIPFTIHSMQDVHHSCPQCHNHLHIHTR